MVVETLEFSQAVGRKLLNRRRLACPNMTLEWAMHVAMLVFATDGLLTWMVGLGGLHFLGLVTAMTV